MEAKTILVAIDFQEASLEAWAVARDLAQRLGLRVVGLHVYTMPMVVYPGFEPIIAPGFSAEVEATAKRAMDRFATSQGGMTPLVRSGDPTTEILKAIDEIKPAMVVLGTHGRKGLEHLLLGSVAERVVRSCSVPVLTVHANAG